MMEALSTFVAMGGYAGFVWPAYGITIVLMVAVLVVSLRSARARESELDLLQKMRPGRERRRRATQESEAS